MSGLRRHWLLALLLVSAIVGAVLWATVPWTWSMVDDPGFVLSVRAAIDQHGFVAGLIAHVGDMAHVDRAWGLFRPAYWVYPSLVYWLPIGLAHLLRLLLLLAALSGPLAALHRRGCRPVVLVVAAGVMLSGATALMFGLFNVSLQELSGAAFVGLGLWSRGRLWRIAWWTVAAWFKVPFAWLLLGEAIALWRAGERRAAVLAGVIAGFTLAAAAAMASGGDYTGAYASGRTSTVISTNLTLLVDMNLILPIMLTAWWFVLARQRPIVDALSTTMIVGFVGYTVQMLPWAVSGHYQGGIAFLLTAALASLLGNPGVVTRTRLLVAVLIPMLVAVSVALMSTWSILQKNERYRGLTECIAANPGASFVVADEFGPEAAVRLAENARIEARTWTGTVVYEGDHGPLATAEPGTLLIVSTAESTPLPAEIGTVCEVPGATVLLVGPSSGG